MVPGARFGVFSGFAFFWGARSNKMSEFSGFVGAG